jgi:ParB-like chromosome segregation protein Spo0J
MQTVNPLDLDLHDATSYTPRHEVRDQAHRDQIAASMTEHGWTGAPIVADTECWQAITGSHRLNAARMAEIDIPAVDIFDLADAAGVDLYDLIGTYGTLEDALPRFCAEVPSHVRDAYGLDID